MVHWVPISVVVVYLIVLFAVTWWARRLTAKGGGGIVGYLLAGRELPYWVGAALLAGLAVGGEVLARIRTPGVRLQLLVAAGLALLGVGIAWLTAQGAATGLVATAGLLLLAGAVTAALLGVATRRGRPCEEPLAGPLLAADLSGGCLGGIAAALVLVPLLGLPGAALATVALAGIAVLVV